MSAARKLDSQSTPEMQLDLVDSPEHAIYVERAGRSGTTWHDTSIRLEGIEWLVTRGLASSWPRPKPRGEIVPLPSQGNPRRNYRLTSDPPRPRRKAIAVCIDDVTPEDVEWLWPGRIALGTVSLIMGREGEGKSTFTGWLASTVATGGDWPDSNEENEPGSVIILTAEEHLATAVRPRLDAFGGTGSRRIHILRGVDVGDGRNTCFSLRDDAELLRELVEEIGDVKLILIDPITSYLRGIGGNNAIEVREHLEPVFRLAEECNLSVMLVTFPNKDSEKDILARVSGSSAFSQMVRASWYFSEDPRDRNRRLVSLMKGNVRGLVKTALAVHYDERRRRITWLPEPVAMSARQVDHALQKLYRDEKVRGAAKNDPKERETKRRRAEEVILAMLAKGPLKQKAAQRRAFDESEIPSSTFRHALRDLLDTDGQVERWRSEDDGLFWLRLRPVPTPEPARPAPRSWDDPTAVDPFLTWSDDGGFSPAEGQRQPQRQLQRQTQRQTPFGAEVGAQLTP